MIGGNVCVRNFYQSGDYASGLAAVFASMRSHDPQIGSIVPRRGLPFAAPVERLRKIKLRICLTGIDIDGALPAIKDRKSTRLNSSHGYISYAVFCLKKKNTRTSSAVSPPRRRPS